MKASNDWIRAVEKPVLRIYCQANPRRPRLVGVVAAFQGKGLVVHRCTGVGLLLTGRAMAFSLPCTCSRRARHVVQLAEVLALVHGGHRAARVGDGGLQVQLGLGHSLTRDAPAERPAARR